MLRHSVKKTIHHYKLLRTDRRFHLHLLVGILLFLLSFLVNFFANVYTRSTVGTPVRDLLLDHLPVLNLDEVYLEGFALFIASIFVVAFHRPYKLPFILKTLALFFVTRSFFIVLTHLSVPLSQNLYNQVYASAGGFVAKLSTGNDLFFSAHTGLPFLLSLLFWENKYLRYMFLGSSILFGVTVLLAHVHYSIDVFSAYFITYTIYCMASFFFKKDKEMAEMNPHLEK